MKYPVLPFYVQINNLAMIEGGGKQNIIGR